MNKQQIFILGFLAVVLLAGGMLFMQTNPSSKTADTTTTVRSDTLSNNSKPMDHKKISGLQITVTKEGSGAEAKKGDHIEVHYTGKLTDGTKFDSSVDRGVPFALTLGAGQVIPGWETGLLGMKVGEERTLTIPPELAYGERGFPGAIPPNATLIFEVKLVSIK